MFKINHSFVRRVCVIKSDDHGHETDNTSIIVKRVYDGQLLTLSTSKRMWKVPFIFQFEYFDTQSNGDVMAGCSGNACLFTMGDKLYIYLILTGITDVSLVEDFSITGKKDGKTVNILRYFSDNKANSKHE